MDHPGCNPKKKFDEILSTLKEKFSTLWTPQQHISIDEGTVPFNGNIHFRVHNTNKPDKYGIKTFKLCDSTNGYCCSFDIYVGEIGNQTVSRYGKTYNLVMSLLENYKKQGYIVYMANFYTSPYLFFNLKVLEGTGACGTARPTKGLRIEIVKAKFKQRGEYKCMTYNDVIVSMRILDRKHVTLLSTEYSCKESDSGRKHWKSFTTAINIWVELILMIN